MKGKSPVIEHSIEDVPNCLRITRSALELLGTLARVAAPFELFAYLGRRAGDPSSPVSEVVVAWQEVDRDSCVCDPDAALRAAEEMKDRGAEIVGWAHSHGDHPPYLSVEDETTTAQLVCEIGCMSATGSLGRAWAWSLVVNAHGAAPFSALMTATLCDACQAPTLDVCSLPVEAIPDDVSSVSARRSASAHAQAIVRERVRGITRWSVVGLGAAPRRDADPRLVHLWSEGGYFGAVPVERLLRWIDADPPAEDPVCLVPALRRLLET